MALIPLITTLFVPVGNSMICSDIWYKYHKWYFEKNLRQFWNITSGICAKYHVQIMLLFVYTTTRKSFVIFTRRYFKLSWNTTAMSKSNCRNFSCSSITVFILTTWEISAIWLAKSSSIFSLIWNTYMWKLLTFRG